MVLASQQAQCQTYHSLTQHLENLGGDADYEIEAADDLEDDLDVDDDIVDELDVEEYVQEGANLAGTA